MAAAPWDDQIGLVPLGTSDTLLYHPLGIEALVTGQVLEEGVVG